MGGSDRWETSPQEQNLFEENLKGKRMPLQSSVTKADGTKFEKQKEGTFGSMLTELLLTNFTRLV